VNQLEVIPISANFRLQLSPKEAAMYSPEVAFSVNKIWEKGTSLTDWDLFDGKVFQLDELHEDYLTGVFSNYRYFYAQNKQPELKNDLNMILVGVAGILQCEDKYLLGKRSDKVTQFPLMWEFAPSGGISIDYLSGETIEYEKQLFEELTEEVGMEWDFVTEVRPFLLILDKEQMSLDICAHLSVDPIGKAIATYDSPEYVAYEWLPKDQIAQFLKGKDVVPMTHALCKNIS